MKYETLRRYCAKMPPLRHYPNKDKGEPFRFEDSEVIQWLLTETRILQRLMESLRESGAIIYDPDTETWHGYQVSKPCSKPDSEVCSKPDSEVCSKPFFLNTVPCSKYPSCIYYTGGGNVCEHKQTPYPLAAPGSVLSTVEKEVGDEPW